MNQHGPFTLREREALDAWIASVPNVGILGGDFNDGIWHASPRRRRIWHDWLDTGRLVDPQYQTAPQPQGPNYQPLAHDDKRPDMMFVVHERVHKYCKLMAHRSPHAIALRIQIPGCLNSPL